MMGVFKERLSRFYAALGPRYMPFADIATPDLSLPRLLRLSLFQVSVGMTLVLLVGTLNRVMIVELDVPATVVGAMVALPLLFAPFRALVGFKSDTHRCELGWRRVPFIWKGTLLQFGGFAIMPFALLVLAGRGEADTAPVWIGYSAAGAAFLLAGAGAHVVQTAGLALATDLAKSESHPRLAGLMYSMLLVGMIASALIFGYALAEFSAARLVQVIQGAAVACVVLNSIAVWKQEARSRRHRPDANAADPSFQEAWAHFCRSPHTIRRLVIICLGTMAFAMSDVLLEPYGGEVLNWSVASTTKLTALLALGGLLGLAYASHALRPGIDPMRIALSGAIIGVPALGLVIVSAPLQLDGAFLIGNFLIGFGAALFGHATLTATMNEAPAEKRGMAVGAWGAVQATAAGLAVALGSMIRDVFNVIRDAGGEASGVSQGAGGYMTVYSIEIALLFATIILTVPLVRRMTRSRGSGLGSPDPLRASGHSSRNGTEPSISHGST